LQRCFTTLTSAVTFGILEILEYQFRITGLSQSLVGTKFIFIMIERNMNGYSLSKSYFEWVFKNQSENNPTMTALYFFLVEINNRLGWREEFSITANECMKAIGVNSYNTYKKNFDKLIEVGFIRTVKKSSNQYQCNIIALSNFDKADDKANSALSNIDIPNDKASGFALSNFDIANETFLNSINNTNNINNIEREKATRFVPPTNDEISFYCKERNNSVDPERFYNYYTSNGWKVGRASMKDWRAAVRTWENNDRPNKTADFSRKTRLLNEAKEISNFNKLATEREIKSAI
ncbi:hypothetical protein JZU68_06820, partial [bacterium]|nr:hypothetical protein [bacterium]